MSFGYHKVDRLCLQATTTYHKTNQKEHWWLTVFTNPHHPPRHPTTGCGFSVLLIGNRCDAHDPTVQLNLVAPSTSARTGRRINRFIESLSTNFKTSTWMEFCKWYQMMRLKKVISGPHYCVDILLFHFKLAHNQKNKSSIEGTSIIRSIQPEHRYILGVSQNQAP